MGVEAAAQLGARVGERRAEQRGGGVAGARPGGDRRQRVGDRAPVDQLPPVGKMVEAG